MFGRQERMAILLLLAVAVSVIAAHLILSSLGKQPFARPFTNISADGELVIAEGQIDQITFTKNGGHMTVYIDNLSIFVPAQIAHGLALQNGDRISVFGVVQTYRGKKEILVSSGDDIRTISQKRTVQSL